MFKKLLLSCFAIFGLTFLLSSNSYAVSDVSVTYTSVPSHYQNLFPTCTGECLSDYKYLVVERSNYLALNYASLPSLFYIRYDGSTSHNYFVDYTSVFSVYELPQFSDSSNNFIQWRQNLPSEIFDYGGLTFTLTNTLGTAVSGTLNITSNGTYDVSTYSSAVVNVPTETVEIVEDPISNDFQKVFFTIVEKIIPAFGVILVVWFGIDMLSSLIFGRGR